MKNISTFIWVLIGIFGVNVLSLAQGERPFITTWKTDNPGETDSTSIIIRTNFEYDYDYDVDWNNDGIYDELNIRENVTHDFGTPGTYTIRIRGDFPHFENFSNPAQGDIAQKLLSIDQWGSIQWESFERSFASTKNMVCPALDTPDLSRVFSVTNMFLFAESFNGEVSGWDVSNIVVFTQMFNGARAFEGDISQWDVSSAQYMDGMFAFAPLFNSDLSQWDVSGVKDMSGMFWGATSFNGDISKWQVGQVRNMFGMFNGATSFDQPLNEWDVSNVEDMTQMFFRCESFNQDLSNWDVSKVTSVSSMFRNAEAFNRDISSWDVSGVKDMQGMFQFASSFNQDLSAWNFDSVSNMDYMFWEAESFDQDLSKWNVGNVNTMMSMLSYSGMSRGNYDSTLIAWDVADFRARPLGAHELTFCAAEQAVINLFNKGWVITGHRKDCPTSVLTSGDFDEVQFFPNPATDYISIRLPDNHTLRDIRIIDQTGKERARIPAGRAYQRIPVSELNPGIYWIQFRNRKGHHHIRPIMIQP
jgi:surface protein